MLGSSCFNSFTASGILRNIGILSFLITSSFFNSLNAFFSTEHFGILPSLIFNEKPDISSSSSPSMLILTSFWDTKSILMFRITSSFLFLKAVLLTFCFLFINTSFVALFGHNIAFFFLISYTLLISNPHC